MNYLHKTAAIVSLLFFVFLTACASQQGNYETRKAHKFMNIKIGETDKFGIFETFGQPANVLYEGAESTWQYANMDQNVSGWSFVPLVGLVAGGTSLNGEFVYFRFSGEGILVDVQSENFNEFVNSWEQVAKESTASMQGKYDQITENVKDEMEGLGLPFDEEATKQVMDFDLMR